MAALICDICGGESAYLVKRPFVSSFKGIPINLEDVEMVECVRCEESTLDPDQCKALSERVKALVAGYSQGENRG